MARSFAFFYDDLSTIPSGTKNDNKPDEVLVAIP